MISASELSDALKSLNFSMTDDSIKKLVDEIDFHGNGMINYSEFVAAILSIEQTLSEEQLWSLFKKFDVDNSDRITLKNLREAFNRFGRFKLSNDEIDRILRQHDIDCSGDIDFEEFKSIFGTAQSMK